MYEKIAKLSAIPQPVQLDYIVHIAMRSCEISFLYMRKLSVSTIRTTTVYKAKDHNRSL